MKAVPITSLSLSFTFAIIKEGGVTNLLTPKDDFCHSWGLNLDLKRIEYMSRTGVGKLSKKTFFPSIIIIIIVYRPYSMLRTGWTFSPNQCRLQIGDATGKKKCHVILSMSCEVQNNKTLSTLRKTSVSGLKSDI